MFFVLREQTDTVVLEGQTFAGPVRGQEAIRVVPQ